MNAKLQHHTQLLLSQWKLIAHVDQVQTNWDDTDLEQR